MKDTNRSALESVPFATLAYALLSPPALVLQVMLQIYAAKQIGFGTAGTVCVAACLLVLNLAAGLLIACAPVADQTNPRVRNESVSSVICSGILWALLLGVLGGGLVIRFSCCDGGQFMAAFLSSACYGFAIHVVGALVPAALLQYRWQLDRRRYRR